MNTVVAFLAIVAQLSGALAPLAEGREGRSASPHVEQGGTSAHWAHNEESCAVCQARSVHATVSRTAALREVQTQVATTPVEAAQQIVTPELLSLGSPRAPPSV